MHTDIEIQVEQLLNIEEEMIEGDLPAKGQTLVREWAVQHKDDLLKIWNTQEFKKIPPLE